MATTTATNKQKSARQARMENKKNRARTLLIYYQTASNVRKPLYFRPTSVFGITVGESSDTKSKCAPNFFHSNAHPGKVVVTSGEFVIIYSSLSLAFPPVVFVFPWLVNFLLTLSHSNALEKRLVVLVCSLYHSSLISFSSCGFCFSVACEFANEKDTSQV